jgi:hypothetical protein
MLRKSWFCILKQKTMIGKSDALQLSDCWFLAKNIYYPIFKYDRHDAYIAINFVSRKGGNLKRILLVKFKLIIIITIIGQYGLTAKR